MRSQRVKIKIDVKRNTVVCGTNGGNLRLPRGSSVLWRIACRRRFQLEFFRLVIEGEPAADTSARAQWPFSDPPRPPAGGVVGPTDEFEGTLKDEGGVAFKYYITVGNLPLDPIIIVDN